VKVGDIVVWPLQTSWAGVGLVIEVGVYAGRKDTKVLWGNGKTMTHASAHLKIVNLEEEIDTMALSLAEV